MIVLHQHPGMAIFLASDSSDATSQWIIFFIFSRYPDILVHRLLGVAIGAYEPYPSLLNKDLAQVHYFLFNIFRTLSL